MPAEMGEMGEMPAAPEAEGKTVCISMVSEEQFSVYMKDGGEPQDATSIAEAFEMAQNMLMGESGDEMSVEQAFQGGFNDQPQPGTGATY